MRAYNSQLGLLLPRLRLDWVGVNLEDFLRRVLLAAKSAHPDNFSYELYPVAKTGETAGMASSSNSDLAQLHEHDLARYHILPQEQKLIALYRKLNHDAQLPSYPRAWERTSFFERYLEAVGFPDLETCFDTLMWFFARHTARSITASNGLELIRTFFVEPAVLTAHDRVQRALDLAEPLVRPGFAAFEHRIEITQSAFQPETRFIMVDNEDAPIEGPNTVIASFSDNPLRLELRSYLLEAQLAQISPFPKRKAELAARMVALAGARLGAFIEADTRNAEDAA